MKYKWNITRTQKYVDNFKLKEITLREILSFLSSRVEQDNLFVKVSIICLPVTLLLLVAASRLMPRPVRLGWWGRQSCRSGASTSSRLTSTPRDRIAQDSPRTWATASGQRPQIAAGSWWRWQPWEEIKTTILLIFVSSLSFRDFYLASKVHFLS